LYDVSDISYGEQEIYDFDNREYVMSDNIYFYSGDFSYGKMEFVLYQQGYETIGDERILVGPVLFIEDENKIELLSQFGELWKPVFKKWFKDNFNYDIKTIDA
jgi:hypothetical protein